MARIINTADLTQESSLNANDSLWIYNGLDCCVTEEVRQNLHPMLDNVATATYEFSKSLQAPVLEMAMRGLLVNQQRKHRVLAEMRQKLSLLQEHFDIILREGVGIEPINWRSPTQRSVSTTLQSPFATIYSQCEIWESPSGSLKLELTLTDGCGQTLTLPELTQEGLQALSAILARALIYKT